MKKNDLFFILFNVVISLIFISIYIISKNILILFILNVFLMGETILNFKISIFSLKSVIINYILFPLIYQYYTGTSYGLLQLNYVDIHYYYIFISIFLYNITSLLFLKFYKFNNEEKKKLKIPYTISNNIGILLCLLAIICSIIAFPTLPFTFNSANRFNALLPGNAWNHVVIICLIFLLGNLKNNKFVKFTFLFCAFWFLSHYERVDMIGIIVLLVFIYFSKHEIKLNFTKYIKYFVGIIILFIGMSYIGATRGGTSINSLTKSLFTQSTACDIAYVYNISIDYSQNYGLVHGNSYKQYIVELIPFISYNKSITNLLKSKYIFPGGEYLLSAVVMNFGIYFIPLFTLIEDYVIVKIIKSKKLYFTLIYLFILTASFRINWYGLIYIETGLVYIIPVLLFIYCKLFKSLFFEKSDIVE